MKKRFATLVFLMLILVGCNDSDNDLREVVTITFGTGSLEEGITDARSTFTEEDRILLEVELLESFGSNDLKFVVLPASDDYENSYRKWYDTVDPDKDYLLTLFQAKELYGSFKPDEYIVRMYVDEIEKIAEGSFSIE